MDYKLQIAGTGPYYNVIKEYALEKNIEDKIRLFGEVKYNDMKKFWENSDIVVSLSDSEGMGLSILEAMSHGAVPIVTDTAGIREFVLDDNNGYVEAIGDVAGISGKIKMLDDDRKKLIMLKGRAWNIIKEKCSEEEYYSLIGEISAMN